jgi:hypothetical protein
MNPKLRLLNQTLEHIEPTARAFIVEDPNAVDILKMQADNAVTVPANSYEAVKVPAFGMAFQPPSGRNIYKHNGEVLNYLQEQILANSSDLPTSHKRLSNIASQVRRIDKRYYGENSILPYQEKYKVASADLFILPEPLASDPYFNQHTLPYMNPGREVPIGSIEGIRFKGSEESEKVYQNKATREDRVQSIYDRVVNQSQDDLTPFDRLIELHRQGLVSEDEVNEVYFELNGLGFLRRL